MKTKLLIILLFIGSKCCAISVVYNLRILQTTSQRATQFPSIDPSIASLTFVDQFLQRRTIKAQQNLAALLASYIYTSKPFYLRVDTAFGHVRNVVNDTVFKRNQTDDIYIAGGYSMQATDRSTITGSAILGIPTHRDTILEGVELGTGHVGIGAQLDGIFALQTERPQSILAATRAIHFIPRSAHTSITGSLQNFYVDIGNLVDLFVAYTTSLGCKRNHRILTGYNASFLLNAQVSPTTTALQTFSPTAIRSNFFASYLYFFKVGEHINGLILGLSTGFEHVPQCYGIKNQTSAWFGWGINF